MSFFPNSMTRHIDANSIAIRVLQLRSEHLRLSQQPITIVIVEGNILDPLIYQSLFSITLCHIEPAYGKENAIKAIAILVKSKTPGVLAIIDDDFDSLNGSKIQSEHIVSTDTHDIENLIIASPAFDKYLLFLLPRDKHKFHEFFVKTARETIIELSIPLGFIRWYFDLKKISADFSKIEFRHFIDLKAKKIDIEMTLREVLANNRDLNGQESEITAFLLENLREVKYDWYLICQGHDLIRILILVLPGMLLTYAPIDKAEQKIFFDNIRPFVDSEHNVVKHLAMCYEKSHFERTRIYSFLTGWEVRNPPYRVLH